MTTHVLFDGGERRPPSEKTPTAHPNPMDKKEKFGVRAAVHEKAPFRPQFLYGFVIFFNIIVLIFSMYMIFTDNTEAISRVVLEAVVIVVIFFFFLYALTCLYDARYFKEEWSLLARLKYKGYVMHYALIHIFAHAVLVVFITVLYIRGENNLTFVEYDILAIMVALLLIAAGILVSEPPYDAPPVLPVTAVPADSKSLTVATQTTQIVRATNTQSSLISTRPSPT